MRSAFGVDHGEIIKYSGAYGVNRIANANIEKEKLKKRKALKAGKKLEAPTKPHDHVNSWFGSASPVKKSWTKNSARLMAAASRGNEYAASRVAAGAQGRKVAQHVQAARATAPEPGVMSRFSRSGKTRRAAQTRHFQAASREKAVGFNAAESAKRIVNESSATSHTRGTSRLATMENKPKQGISGSYKLLGIGAGAGAAGGAGYAYSQRKRTA
jgi:hypothetical protein